MREFNYFSLVVMGAASFFAWNAIAAPAPAHSASANAAQEQKVHLLNNLKESDLKLVMKIMQERGYKVVPNGLFTESSKTVTITQALADEVDPGSVEIQVLSLDKKGALPKTVFNHKVVTDDVTEALQALPRPGELPQLGKNQ